MRCYWCHQPIEYLDKFYPSYWAPDVRGILGEYFYAMICSVDCFHSWMRNTPETLEIGDISTILPTR